MAKKAENKPEGKTFNLKGIETEMVKSIVGLQNTQLTNFLSFTCVERLAYQPTPNTHFQLNDDFTAVTITEVEPEAPAEDAGVIETPPTPTR
jgi:hypothetical protein